MRKMKMFLLLALMTVVLLQAVPLQVTIVRKEQRKEPKV
ncbi:hypothetical protein LSPH24S_00556 [Lysinibacillus sphaericus]